MTRHSVERAVDSLGNRNPYRSPLGEIGRLIPYAANEPSRYELLRKRLLFRRIRFETPLQMELEYDAFGLFDEIRIDGRRVLRRLPLVRFIEHFRFEVATDEGAIPIEVDLKFRHFARIRSFRVSVAGRLIYEEAG